MKQLADIAARLRQLAADLERLALGEEINRRLADDEPARIAPADLVEQLKQEVNDRGNAELLQKVSDILWQRFGVARVVDLTPAQATELAGLIKIDIKA